MTESRSCYCSNIECARAGRCLNEERRYSNVSVIPWITQYVPPPKLITTLDDDDVLRIANKVVELLAKTPQPIEQVGEKHWRIKDE